MRKLSYVLVGIILAMIIYFSFSGRSNSDAYEKSVWAEREKKEKYLRSSSDSPFVLRNLEMGELFYFPIDPKYKVSARVDKLESRDYMMIRNSDGTTLRYLKYAWLSFELEGTSYKLLALKPMFGVGLFLGFADGTSGEESYGGGRYLDLEEIKGDRITIDFNLAYNPYCAYAANYTCPLPPKENVLGTDIVAGEMNYSK